MSVLALGFPAIDPVAIQLGPLAIRWYALAYLVGLLLGWRLVRRLVAGPGWRITPEQVDDLLFYMTLGIILGGRLGYVLFYDPGQYLAAPWRLVAVWQGGMSFHGGVLGVIAAAWLFARNHRVPLLDVTDAVALVGPIGLFLGRLANFVNGELWGRPTDLPWGVVFPHAGPEPRHPSQLYEAFLEGIVLFAILQLVHARSTRPADAGLLGGTFLAGYAVFRFLVEFVREPDAQLGLLAGGLTMGQLLCLPMLALGLGTIAWSRRHAAAR